MSTLGDEFAEATAVFTTTLIVVVTVGFTYAIIADVSTMAPIYLIAAMGMVAFFAQSRRRWRPLTRPFADGTFPDPSFSDDDE